MSKKTWALVLKAPALMLLIASFLAGVYASIYNIQEMGYEVPIILGVVIFLYLIGANLEKRYYKEKEASSNSNSRPMRRVKEEKEELVIPEDEETF